MNSQQPKDNSLLMIKIQNSRNLTKIARKALIGGFRKRIMRDWGSMD